MQSITYRERPLAYRRSINALLTLGTVGALAWRVHEYRQSGGVVWDPFEIILVLIVWIGAHFVMRRASVTFDGRGLTYAIDGTSRHWAWSELSAPEIHSRDGRVDAYIRFRPEKLDWMARLTWLGWRSRPEIRIPHTYDAPLTDICAKLNEYRDRALDDNGATAHIETDDRGATIVVYRERANRGRWPIMTTFAACLIVVLWFVEIFPDWRSGTVTRDLWSPLLILPWVLVIWFLADYAGGKGPGTLKLEDQGLTYAHGTNLRSWAWAELSAPEIQGAGGDAASYIRLHPNSRIDWEARIIMPGISLNGSEIRIRPIFDAPLTDIAAMLNEYRDRALGAASATRPA